MDYTNTLIGTLGIETRTLEKNLIVMTMPVDHRTKQPTGFLHGGASVALAESAASVGSYMNVDQDLFSVFGIEINANHIKSKRDGIVTAKATPAHLGKTTMVWEVRIVDEDEKLICLSRCTIGVVPNR